MKLVLILSLLLSACSTPSTPPPPKFASDLEVVESLTRELEAESHPITPPITLSCGQQIIYAWELIDEGDNFRVLIAQSMQWEVFSRECTYERANRR